MFCICGQRAKFSSVVGVIVISKMTDNPKAGGT